MESFTALDALAIAASSLASMALDSSSRVLSSCTLPLLDSNRVFAVSMVFASFESFTASTAFFRLPACFSYHAAASSSSSIAVSSPPLPSATQPSYSGASTSSAVFSASRVFASFT